MLTSAEARWQPRLTRGICAAGFATLMALMGHLLGGGAMPAWQGILAPGLFTAVVAALIAGHRATLPRLWAISAIAQVFFHNFFVLGADAHVTAHAGHWSAAMITTHAVASFVTALAQLHAERALLAVVGFTHFVLSAFARPGTAPTLSAHTRPGPAHRRLPHLTSTLLATCRLIRGPPATLGRHPRTA